MNDAYILLSLANVSLEDARMMVCGRLNTT
jgi:hypothetical protein